MLKFLPNVKNMGYFSSFRHKLVSCPSETKDDNTSLWYSLRKGRESAFVFFLVFLFGRRFPSELFREGNAYSTVYVFISHPISELSKYPCRRICQAQKDRRYSLRIQLLHWSTIHFYAFLIILLCRVKILSATRRYFMGNPQESIVIKC